MQQLKVAIIGAGPAGTSAAIYLSRAQLAPTLYTGLKSGGQLMFTADVENYAGFPNGIKGPDLMIAAQQQAGKFGTKIEYLYITAVDFSARPFKLWTADAGLAYEEIAKLDDARFESHLAKIKALPHDVEAEAVVITTGSEAIRLGVPGEDKFFGRGVSVCAVCDAAFFKDKKTTVVGGGDSAMEDALALTKFATSVTVVHRRDSFKASKIMTERVLNNPKIKVLWNSELKEVVGNEAGDKVHSIKILNNKDKVNGEAREGALGQNKESIVETDGVFFAIGHKPVTRIFGGQIALDTRGYIVTKQSPTKEGVEMASKNLDENGVVTYPTMTSVEGVFAAGDQVDIRYKQAIAAAGAGAMAAIDTERWIESQAAPSTQTPPPNSPTPVSTSPAPQ